MNSSNNFNSQFNSMNNSTNNTPMQPVKNRFFNQDLFNDADVSDVGSSMSNQVTNWRVQNESSMVASADFKNMLGPEQPIAPVDNSASEQLNPETPKQNQFASIFSQDLLENVNATVYEAEPEVLDDDFLANDSNANNTNNMNVPNNTLFGYTENEVLDTPDNNVEALNNVDVLDTNDIYNNQIGAVAPVFNQNVDNNPSSQTMIDQNLISQQPLSMNSLGATPVNNQQIPEVAEDSKYFPTPDAILEKEKEMQNANKPPFDLMTPSLIDEEVIVIDETALMKAYAGNNYDKCLKSNFSAFAMLFGSLAFFCKSMYFVGILFFVFQVAILYLFRDIPYIILASFVVIAMIMALLINPLYLSLVRNKVRKIRKKHPKVSQGDLNNICAKKGRNNTVVALLLQIILLGGTAFLAIQLLGVDYFKDIYKDVLNMFNKPKEEIKYNGELKYTDLNIEDYFYIKVPSDYRKEDDTNFSYTYVTEGVGDYNACSFKFGGVEGYDSASQLLTKMADYYKVSTDIDTVKYNGLEWYLLYIDEDNGKTYYRATDIDNQVVLFEFTSGANTPTGICDSQIVIILDSIEKK